MLELQPNSEIFDIDLPAHSAEARICSYEFTYCAACADALLKGVCPNCGGEQGPRPIRPIKAHRHGLNLGLTNHAASTKFRQKSWQREEIRAFVQPLNDIPPEQR